MTKLWIAASVLLAGCASSKEPDAAATATACNIGGELIKPHIGQAYSAELANDLKKRSRSAVLRVVRPGEMVTMDFRADRLTLRLDERGRIAGAACG